MAVTILIVQATATWFMTGLIWFVQVTHYPLMNGVAANGYGDYQRRHMARTTFVVAPAMLVELLTALAMIWIRPASVPMWAVWCGLAAVALVWASTALLQVPMHERLTSGFDAAAHRRLVFTNWLRTLAWSARGVLVAWMLLTALDSPAPQ